MAHFPASIGEPVPSRFTRRTVALLLLPLLLVPLIRFFALQGFVRPVRVASGSMAGAFYGPHIPVSCGDCGITFRCGAEYVPESQLAVCPNCGFASNRLEPDSMVEGKRVVIDRWSHWMHNLQAWQPVAFASKQNPDHLAIKRLVAGDGGQLEIRDGDLFVDGVVQRKTLDQLRQTRVLVHDDRFRPQRTARLPDRWRSRQADSLWRTTATGYAHAAADNNANPILAWLEYTQWTCWPNPSPPAARTTSAGILDHYAYNQNVSRSGLKRVDDVMLQCELTVGGKGVVVLHTNDGADCFRLEITSPELACRLHHNGQVVWQAPHALPAPPWIVEWAVCDRRVLAAIDGVSLLQYSYQPTAGPRRSDFPPLAVGAAGLQVQFNAPQIYRDLYYLGPSGENRWKAPQRLEPGEWFVMGDNVPVSVDSRRSGPIADAAIIGPVLQLAE